MRRSTSAPRAAVSASAQSAARTPGTLLAAIEAPVPVQQAHHALVGAQFRHVARGRLARPRPVVALALGQRPVEEWLVAAFAQGRDERLGDPGSFVGSD